MMAAALAATTSPSVVDLQETA